MLKQLICTLFWSFALAKQPNYSIYMSVPSFKLKRSINNPSQKNAGRAGEMSML